LPRIVAERPYAYFAKVSQLFNSTVQQEPGVHPSAVVAKSAKLGKGVSIGAGCVVGEGVTIGEGTCLYPRVVIYPNCSLGKRVILHSGVVIGADGFGIAPEDGRWVKIPQIGGVRIGDDVEIGANTTIDRGALDDTVIEEGVKLDNQIQVAHNVRIGAHTAIAACTGIAGSADIGRHCIIGGAAMIHGHIRIADHVKVSAGTLISRSLTRPGTYTGIYPFDEHEAWKRGACSCAGWRREKRKAEMDIYEVLEYLPQRYPILMIDKVKECDPGKRIVAIKNVSANEPQFLGHFPGRPIMPGVMILGGHGAGRRG
jgi:UDP-3-O-[3-hydroxymyristoyl] glucosamine N-acyltransferase